MKRKVYSCRHFEGAWHPDLLMRRAGRFDGLNGTRRQFLGNIRIEIGGDDEDMGHNAPPYLMAKPSILFSRKILESYPQMIAAHSPRCAVCFPVAPSV